MSAPAPAFAAYEHFYPSEPLETREQHATRLRENVQILRHLAQGRLAGLAKLKSYAREPGTDLESLLHFVWYIEGEMRGHVRGDTRQVNSMRRRLRAAKKAGFSRSDLEAIRASVDAVEQVAAIDRNLLDAVRACRHDVEELRSARLAEYTGEWLAYLDRLAADQNHAAIAGAVKRFWEWIAPRLWAPEAAPTEDSFLMTWDRDKHRLQVVLDPDSSFGWSYYNQETEEFIMEEGQNTGRFSQRFKAALARMSE